MAAPAGIQWDMAALRSVLEHSAPLRAELERLGRDGIDHAKSIAPDRVPLRVGYIDSFVATIGHTRDGLPALVIANTDFKAIWIERGTAPHGTGTGGAGTPVSIPAHHVLDRTLDHLRR